jgi:hypothetical protein
MPINSDHQADIEKSIDILCESLFSAWGYFHLLQGLHEGSKIHRSVIKKFDHLFDQIWRAGFDGLFSMTGTIIDRTKATYSLPGLITKIRKAADTDLLNEINLIENMLNAKEGPLTKIGLWRNKIVAHRTKEGKDPSFREQNSLKLPDIADALLQLSDALNKISFFTINRMNDTKSGTQELVTQGVALFTCLAPKKRKRKQKLSAKSPNKRPTQRSTRAQPQPFPRLP